MDAIINSWRKLFESVKTECSRIHYDLPELIETNLNDVFKKLSDSYPQLSVLFKQHKQIEQTTLFNNNFHFFELLIIDQIF